ncbi:MAG: phosphoribosylamine--glycine ligase [Cyanosarcina radialis HA8281-LM2]|jgi:phosphoribosylamine--glycine ligase|nr:phosphoribosylamine--glycine ligase [Cyanosarcina radialis HA8281-LM2]
MKILVIGNGGREHAIAWKLLQSEKIQEVICIPGNGGTATMPKCRNYAGRVDDFDEIIKVARTNDISLVVVGPELPLSLGISDRLQSQNIKVFGPTQAGAEIEASKSWAKSLMQEAGIPTAKAEIFTDAAAAKAYVATQGAPIVVKADGLAAGKGVIVAPTVEEAQTAIDRLFESNFEVLVVEECLTGEEVSVLALTDGLTIRPLLPAQDHKRIGEGDTGANTGGMGAYAPAPILTPELMARVQTEVLEPAIATLQKRGIDYRGVLYAGLMISPQGDLKVLEFNCRFGDPETQAILPLLETPLEDLLLACSERKLEAQPPIAWKPGVAACVVLSSGGYPGDYQTGKVITGIAEAEDRGATVFHAGTQSQQEKLLTDGGRVFGVTGVGENFAKAIDRAYAAVNCIQFEAMYYRRDIGHRMTS